MTRLLALTLVTLLAALTAASTAVAQGRPADVQRVERAVLELDKAKRSLVGEVAAHRAVLERSLKRCKNGGKGWKRINKVRNHAQRRTYRRGARILWSELHRVMSDRAALDIYHPLFDRFLAHFDTPLSDPVIQAGVEAHRKRLAYNEEATAFSTCATFNKLTRAARRYSSDATGDSLAGDVFVRLSTYVRERELRATRRLWGSRYERALLAARDRLQALGGNGGYANYFAFAYSLRA
jgi:hypothetical protein